MSNVFVIIHYCHGSKAIWWCAADSHKRMPFTTAEDGIGRFEMPGNKLVAWLQTSVMTGAHWAGSWRVVPFPRGRFQPLTFKIWFRGASRKQSTPVWTHSKSTNPDNLLRTFVECASALLQHRRLRASQLQLQLFLVSKCELSCVSVCCPTLHNLSGLQLLCVESIQL